MHPLSAEANPTLRRVQGEIAGQFFLNQTIFDSYVDVVESIVLAVQGHSLQGLQSDTAMNILLGTVAPTLRAAEIQVPSGLSKALVLYALYLCEVVGEEEFGSSALLYDFTLWQQPDDNPDAGLPELVPVG